MGLKLESWEERNILEPILANSVGKAQFVRSSNFMTAAVKFVLASWQTDTRIFLPGGVHQAINWIFCLRE